MNKLEIPGGTVHKLPADLRKTLTADSDALLLWNDITPLARNEWICWVVTNKKPQTRLGHIERVVTELLQGKRRPCCWAGCIHRERNGKY